MNKKFFCATPAPLLWKGLFFFIPLLVVAFIVLLSQTLIRMYANKKRGKGIFDKQTKILSLWSVVFFLSLATYGVIGLDFNFYLLEFFLLTVFVLGAFYLGEHLKLFKISRRQWIIFASLSILFATFFAVCFLNSVYEKKAFTEGLQANCVNRLLF